MVDKLKPPPLSEASISGPDDDVKGKENLRLLSRSPHPYHRRNDELLEPSGLLATSIPAIHSAADAEAATINKQHQSPPSYTKDSTTEPDSGSEADDELYAKRLPAPKAALHKGLRGRHELLSETSTPLLTPTTSSYDCNNTLFRAKIRIQREEDRRQLEAIRRNRELKRRATEVLILGVLSWLVLQNPDVKPFVVASKQGKYQQHA